MTDFPALSRSASTDSPNTMDESTPLLPKPSAQQCDEKHPRLNQWAQEMWFLTRSSIPIILAYTLQNSIQTVSVIIAGRLSPEALATAAFSYMFAMATAWLVALGGTTAIDTLASSSFTGSQNKVHLGILLQRGIFVLSIFYAIIAVLWWHSEPLFRALGQEEFICTQSSRFLRLLIPGGLGYVWFESMKKYLQAQGLYRPGTYVLLITSPASALLNYLLVHRFGMGLDGAPIATGIAYWCSFLLLVLYTATVQGKECWGGLNIREAMSHLWPFIRLAFLGFIHVGTEWWAFEIVAIVSGQLGTVPLAAQSVIMTADQIINTVPFGLGVAASVRVGNLLGARKPREAARAAHCAAVLSLIFGTAILVVLVSTKDVFGRIFNDDERVIHLVSRVMPLVGLFQLADGLNGSCGGVLRGMGRQWVGALVNLLSYYGGALPAGIYLAFHGWELSGLWVGQCIALYIVGVLEWIIVSLSNWENEVARALGRLEGQGGATKRDQDGGSEDPLLEGGEYAV